jgi:hypothetical protein
MMFLCCNRVDVLSSRACTFINVAVISSMWQWCHRCGSDITVVAVLPTMLQCCYRCGIAAIVSGSAAIVVAVLPSLVAVLLSLWQCCHYCGNAVIVWLCCHVWLCCYWVVVLLSYSCSIIMWLCFHSREFFYLFSSLAAFL